MTSDFSRRAAGSSGRPGTGSGIAGGPRGPHGPGEPAGSRILADPDDLAELVRNYYEGFGTQTTSSKLEEIFIVKKLADMKSKQWILTSYLNVIYLGHNSYGVAAAAQTYFGLPVSQLTIAQDAVLASLIKQPSNYPLPQYRAGLKGRWSAAG